MPTPQNFPDDTPDITPALEDKVVITDASNNYRWADVTLQQIKTLFGIGDMLKSENLSGLADYGAARNNLGLGNVDNTSDANKPVSTLQALADAATLSLAQAYADNFVAGLLDYRGGYDASSNLFPTTGGSGTAGAVAKGDMWVISVAGTLGGQAVQIGDSIIANVSTPGQTAGNWNILDANVSYVPEDVANKSTSVITDQASNIKYPSVKAVYDWGIAAFASLAGSISQAFSVSTLDVGNADTTLSRSGAGQLAMEGVDILSETNTKTVSNKTLTQPKIVNGGFIADANGNEQIIFTTIASAVNEVTHANSATGNAPSMKATGGDTNINMILQGKGTGGVIANLFAPQGFLINGKIVPSVASSNLTVAIKTLAGTDPSVSNPVFCRIGDIVYTISSAISAVANAGSNWFNSGSSLDATFERDYFVYLGYSTTLSQVVLGFSRLPYFQDFSTNSFSSSDQRFMQTIGGVGTVVGGEVIGRFPATLSAGAGYTWSLPTLTSTNLIQRPIFETRWMDFSSLFTFGGTMSASSTTKVGARFRISYNIADISLCYRFTLVAPASDSIVAEIPVYHTTTNAYDVVGHGAYYNTTNDYGLSVQTNNTDSSKVRIKRVDAAVFTMGASQEPSVLLRVRLI